MAKQALQAGDLDRKLDLFTLDPHKNNKGESVGQSETAFAQNIPCRKEEKGGKEELGADSESIAGSRQTAFGRVDFTIRYRSDIKPTMILYCEGVQYDILNIREGETRRQWTIISAQKHD